MSRRRGYLPAGNGLVISTCGRIRGRCLPHPSDELNEILIAFLAQARRGYPVSVFGTCVTSVEERGALVLLRSRNLHAAAAGSTRRGGKAKKVRVPGVKAIKNCEPHTRPEDLKSSPAPDFHAVDPDVRRDLRKEYRDFAEEYSR
ncbi:MAG: hypothetical protein GY856_33670, partial [bacterium]|nr:hypothetical protein [bacterium]